MQNKLSYSSSPPRPHCVFRNHSTCLSRSPWIPCEGQLEAWPFVTQLAPWTGGGGAPCVAGTTELRNSRTYRNTFTSVGCTWLGRDFHKHFNIIKPESCLSLGNGIQQRIYNILSNSNFIFKGFKKPHMLTVSIFVS